MTDKNNTTHRVGKHLRVAILDAEPEQRLAALVIGLPACVGCLAVLSIAYYYLLQTLTRIWSSGIAVGDLRLMSFFFAAGTIVLLAISYVAFRRIWTPRSAALRVAERLRRATPGVISEETAARGLAQLWRGRTMGNPAVFGISRTLLEDVETIETELGVELPRVFVGGQTSVKALHFASARWKRDGPCAQRVRTFGTCVQATVVSGVLLAILIALTLRIGGIWTSWSFSAPQAPSAAPSVVLVSLLVFTCCLVALFVHIALQRYFSRTIVFAGSRVRVIPRRRGDNELPLAEFEADDCVVVIRRYREKGASPLVWEFRPRLGIAPFYSHSFDPSGTPWDEPARALVEAGRGQKSSHLGT